MGERWAGKTPAQQRLDGTYRWLRTQPQGVVLNLARKDDDATLQLYIQCCLLEGQGRAYRTRRTLTQATYRAIEVVGWLR